MANEKKSKIREFLDIAAGPTIALGLMATIVYGPYVIGEIQYRLNHNDDENKNIAKQTQEKSELPAKTYYSEHFACVYTAGDATYRLVKDPTDKVVHGDDKYFVQNCDDRLQEIEERAKYEHEKAEAEKKHEAEYKYMEPGTPENEEYYKYLRERPEIQNLDDKTIEKPIKRKNNKVKKQNKSVSQFMFKQNLQTAKFARILGYNGKLRG